MRRRAPFVLILLAGLAVCLLLWETVLAPALEDGNPDDESSMIGGGGALSAEAQANGGGPTLSGRAGRALSSEAAAGGLGPDGGGGDGPLGAGLAGSASVPFQGRVLDPRGGTAGGVSIVIKGAGGVETITTDADGRFQHALRPGRYALLFQGADGGLLLRSWMLDGAVKDDLEFTLREPGALAIKVRRGDEGIPAAQVTVTSQEMGELATFQAATDPDGRSLFEGLVPGRYEVLTQVPDGPLARATAFASAGGTREVTVLVPEGLVLRGLVRAGENGPGVQARITLESAARGSAGVFVTTIETQADGTYEAVVPKGAARLFRVEAEGFAPWPALKQMNDVLRSLRGLAKAGPLVRNVTLTEGLALTGVVMGEDKTPLPAVALRFVMRRGGPTVGATSQADGSYGVAHLNPGAYELQVESPSYFPIAGQLLRVTIPPGSSTQPVTFDVTLVVARRLAGLVVDGAGQGLGGARVWIMGGGRVVRSARDAGRDLEVFTNADGSWVISDIPPDRNVILRAAMGDLEADPVPAPWDRPPPQPIRMTLEGTATLRGAVVDIGTRTNLARAQVRIQPDPFDGRSARTVVTNQAGEFLVEHMLPGRWKLLPVLGGYLPAEAQSVDLQRDGESRVTLPLDPGEVFAGVVQNEAGAPLVAARVRVFGRPFDAERDVSRTANTDKAGRFRLTGFRQGVYEVRVTRTGFRTAVVRDMRRGDENLRFLLVVR